MSHVGITRAEQDAVFALLAAVLHLGNVAFEEHEAAAAGAPPDAPGSSGVADPPLPSHHRLSNGGGGSSHHQGVSEGSRVAREGAEHLAAAAALLGVSAQSLAETLTTRRRMTHEGVCALCCVCACT